MSFKLQPVSSKQPDEDSDDSFSYQEPKNKKHLKKVSIRSKNIHKCSSKQSNASGKFSGYKNRQDDSMVSDNSQELSDDGSFQTGSQFEDVEEEKQIAEEE